MPALPPPLTQRSRNLSTLRWCLGLPLGLLALLVALGGLGAAAATGDPSHLVGAGLAAALFALPALVILRWR